MNKKSIKYLIWTILITATLILMPITSSEAVRVEYDDFAKSRNLFCLNKNYSFRTSETFSERTVYEDCLAIPDTNTCIDTQQLKYIVLESVLGNYGTRTSISSYEPQIAIWDLINGVYGGVANQLIADAHAYADFEEGGDVIPKIVKEDENSFAIFYKKNTVNEAGCIGEYTNLISVEGSGFDYNYSEVSLSNNTEGYNRKRIYTKYGNAETVTVRCWYETRNVDLKLYSSPENTTNASYTVYKDNNNTPRFFIINSDGSRKASCCPTEGLVSEPLPTGSSYHEIYANHNQHGCGNANLTQSFCSNGCRTFAFYACRNCGWRAVGQPGNSVSFATGNTETVYGIDIQNLLYGNGYVNQNYVQDTITFIKPVELTFNKTNFTGADLTGATIQISGADNVSNINKTSITIGKGEKVKITPQSNNSGTFKIKLKETAPAGYKEIPETTLTVTYNNGTVTGISSDKPTYVPVSGSYVTIKNRPAVKLTFNKQDFNGTNLKEAKISVVKGTGVSKIEGLTNGELTSDNNGSFGTITVYPTHASYDAGDTGEFKLKVKETKVPTGYQGMPGEVTLTVKYNTKTGAVISITEDSENITSSGSNITVKNKPKVNLIITKIDSLTRLPLAGARFKIELANVESIEGYDMQENGGDPNSKLTPNGLGDVNDDGKINLDDIDLIGKYLARIIELDENQKARSDANEDGKITIKDATEIQKYISYKIIYATSSADGQVKLTGIVPEADLGNKITVRITEISVPDGDGYYYEPIVPIIIEFEYADGQWKKVSGDITITNFNNVNLQIENQPLIDLSGRVWQDGQQGEKVVAGPDGKINVNESGIKGIPVGLKNVTTGNIEYSTTTIEDGSYKFEGVPYLGTNSGYQVVFSYDGINWQETNSIRNATGGDSDATEIDDDRTAFNNKFKTISKGIARATNGETIPLSYEYDSENDKSTLRAGIDGQNPAKGLAMDFQMKAQTGTYLRTTSNIDCGLVKKEFDLAIGTDVKKATLKINDKETTYTHQQIINGELNDLELDNILQNNSATSNEDVKYNLYLYASDYNYRIDDYKTGITNKVDSEEYKYEEDTSLEELEAYVTYSVMLKNQTTYSAIVDEFVYYYDDVYTPHNIVSTDKYAVSIDETNRKITFTNLDGGLTLNAPNYSVEIELTFKVNKDANGNIITKTATNVAEITRYSTHEGGLIDKDSAPDNGITNGQITQYEDDTDEAKGIDISVRDKETRTISGIVFNDTYKNTTKTEYDKDGILNNTNNRVNDVIVQLIEIRKINDKYYEYIWQETISGSNQVKTTARNGYEGVTYTNSVQAGSGQYEFKDYIPGNYIIRYIYGDGTTENVQTYNGQDYKSTKDVNYTEQFYNDVMYNSTSGKTNKYSENSSVARDNEARRLEVMSYSTMIDKDKGEKLANKTDEALANTWMAAETSTIKVPVDADDTSTTQDSTNVSYNNIGNTVSFANVNFGLALRPQTKLVLEKHITGLKITPNGTGVQPIIDAKANIGKIVEDGVIETTGVTEGLAPILSTRGNRGFWQVATDVEELTQGAALEVEYTYVLKNVSEEKDYLSSELVDEFETNLNNYSTYLQNIVKPGEGNLKNTLRGNTHKYGEYLGQYYYNGNSAGCKEVSSRIETVEEAVNNDLKFEESEYFTKVNTDVVSKNVYDTNGALATENINTVLQTKDASEFITPNEKDYSKKITLKTTLTSVTGGELGANLPSYIAEITKYSNAAGRRDMSSVPANLSYAHSNDTRMTMENSNEPDEFWGETIIITKPTGEDRITPIQIILTTISALAVLGVGIILIKKIALKK